MADVFQKPLIPGTFITFEGVPSTQVPPSFAEVVATEGTATWGPVGTDAPGANGTDGGVQLVTSAQQLDSLFGTDDTPLRRAVLGALVGQGVAGVGGAGGVLVWRHGTGAARATHAIQNTTPAAALTLTAKYRGTKGNDISYAIAADPNVPANDRLRILVDGVEQERYSYVRTDVASVAAAINLRSKWVTAASTITGVALTTTTGTSLTGGSDGSTPDSTDFDAWLAAVEYKEFSLLAPSNLTDNTLQTLIYSWVTDQAAANRPVMLVMGGPAAEGTFHDDLFDADLSMAQLAPRAAGILAARGDSKALTYAEIVGLSIASVGTGITDGLTRSAAFASSHVVNLGATAGSDEIRPAIDGGLTVLMQASMPNAELRIAQGVTTFTRKDLPTKPYDVFSEPRFVRIMDIYVRGMKLWGDDKVIGDLPVNADTRAAVYGEARRRQDDLLTRGLIEGGDAARGIDPPFVDTTPPNDPALADAVPYRFGWQFTRTANYVIGNGTVK